MSVANLTTSPSLASALGQRYPDLRNQWNRKAESLALVPKKAGFAINAAFDIGVGGAAAGTVAEGADIVTGQYLQDGFVPATLSWGIYQSGFGLSHLAMAAAASSGGSAPGALVDIVGQQVIGCLTALGSKLNVDLLLGNGTGENAAQNIVGLTGGALPVAGQTYATVAVNSQALWASNVLANGGVARPLTVDLLNSAERLQYVRSGMRGDFIICSPGVYQKYAALFTPNQRINSNTSVAVLGTGAQAYEFMGMPIVRDKDLTEGNMIFMNSSCLELQYLPPSSWASVDAAASARYSAMSSQGDFMDSLGLPISMYSVAKTGGASKFFFEIMCQLVVKRPNAFVLIQDLSTT